MYAKRLSVAAHSECLTFFLMLIRCHSGPSKYQQDDEQPGPSRPTRQQSMSETMPLYTLCKEDLESMDKEVRRPAAACLFVCLFTERRRMHVMIMSSYCWDYCYGPIAKSDSFYVQSYVTPVAGWSVRKAMKDCVFVYTYIYRTVSEN